MSRNINEFASPFTFKDANEIAKSRKMSIDELVYLNQVRWDNPNAEVSLKDAMLEYHDAILSSVEFKDGIENKYAYNGYTVLDTNLRRPAFKTYAMKHVPHIYGGGAVETDKGFFTTPILNEGRLASGNQNKVNLVNFASETLEAPIVPITLGINLGIIDEMKYDTIGFDAIAEKQKSVHMSYQIELDIFGFVGHRGIKSGVDTDTTARGLLNLKEGDAVYRDLQVDGDYGLYQEKRFEYMTTPQLVDILAEEYLAYLNTIGFDERFAPNKWLVYPALMSKLSKPAHINYAGTVYRSTLEYIKQVFKDWAIAYDTPEVKIEVLPYLGDKIDAFNPLLMTPGVNGTGRTILYRQDPNILRSRIALDLTPGALVYDVVNNQIRRNYIAFIGTPLLFYPGQFRYIDNGKANEVVHKLTLDRNTGKLAGKSQNVVFSVVDKSYVALHLFPEATKDSNTFLGWSETSNGAVITDYQILIDEDTTLYAIFSE